MQTRTDGYPIGFRRGWSDWQKDLGAVIDWAKADDLSVPFLFWGGLGLFAVILCPHRAAPVALAGD